jgi:nicotinate-nucleotide adenylyltransferase
MINRVGFFAGTFDPIHDGHLEVARSSVIHLELNTLYFMVESEPWVSKSPVAVEYRQSMVELAIEHDEKIMQLYELLPHFSISTTLPKLEAKFPESELYFVFGGDVFLRMNRMLWQGLENLLKHHIVVFERSGVSHQSIEQHARKLGIVVAIIPSTHAEHASTDVRLAPHEKNVWLPSKVASYIKSNNLYSKSID